MTTDLRWEFEPTGAWGGAASAAFRNPLAGAGELREDLFGREAIQNSCDAARGPSARVRVRFRRRTLKGRDLERALDALEIKQLARRRGVLGRAGAALVARPEQVRVLFVEDYETAGLGGGVGGEGFAEGEGDRFWRLCFKLGVKEPTAGRGGSFGYGKSVYWAGSDFQTVAFYSVFDAGSGGARSRARFLAVSWFDEHDFEGKHWTGRAFLGRSAPAGSSSTRVLPLEDEDAHRLAAQLGFARRSAGETGCSISILGSALGDMDRLRRGIESSWWPRLLDDRLAVELEDEGKGLPPPEPRERRDLRAFVRAYEVLAGTMGDPAGPRTRAGDIEVKRRGRVGRWTAAAEEGEESPGEVPEVAEEERRTIPRLGTVALMRGPRMVVQYHPSNYRGAVRFGAVFAADAPLEATFQKAEPPTHNGWDPETTRDLSPEERVVVAETLKNVRKAAREFAAELEPLPPEPPPRCRELEKLLGKFLPSKVGPPPPPPPGTDRVEIRYVEGPRRVGSGADSAMEARIRVGVRDGAISSEGLLRCHFEVRARLLADDVRAAAEPLGIATVRRVRGENAEIVRESGTEERAIELKLREGGFVEFEVRSGSMGDPEYRAGISARVRGEE